MALASAIQKHAAGQKVRRLTLFDNMGKSPDSGPSRQLIVNSNKYGLTKGNYTSEHLELTPGGALATGADVPAREKLAARFKLAIDGIAPFKALYDALKGNRLPAASVLEDKAKEHGVPAADAKECVELFIVNAKFLGILKPIAGAERIIPLEQATEDLPEIGSSPKTDDVVDSVTRPTGVSERRASGPSIGSDPGGWSSICFYISPIGEPDSEQRQHADLFLGSIVEPALEEFGLKVVRADRIGKPGMSGCGGDSLPSMRRRWSSARSISRSTAP